MRSASQIFVIAVVLVLAPAAGAASVSNSFASGNDGWRSFSCSAPVAAAFIGSGGNPGGFIAVTDGGSPDTCEDLMVAPVAFSGDLRANYGGAFKIDVRHPSPAQGPQVFITTAAGDQLGAQAPTPAANVWTAETFTLTESNWQFFPAGGNGAGQVATRSEFFDVLAHAAQIQVMADFDGAGTGKRTDVDNPILAEPQTPLDTDGDGVTNAADTCPAVAGAAANQGCPAPAPPTLTATDPSSLANENSPKVKGTLADGLATQIQVFTNAACAGSPVATGTPAAFTGAGIAVSVPDNSSTPLSARAVSATGPSVCSNSLTYAESTPATSGGPPPGTATPPSASASSPPKQLAGRVSASFNVLSRYTKVIKFQIRDVPAGADVVVACAGRGCPFRERSVTPRGGKADLSKALRKARLGKGAKLQVRITKDGSVGKLISVTVDGRHVPRPLAVCIPKSCTL